MNRCIWISIDHVPGKNNVADKFSREFNDSVEWKIGFEFLRDFLMYLESHIWIYLHLD